MQSTQRFYYAFLDVFVAKCRSVTRYEAHVAKLYNRSGFMALSWSGVQVVEQKSAGCNLKVPSDRLRSNSMHCPSATACATFR